MHASSRRFETLAPGRHAPGEESPSVTRIGRQWTRSRSLPCFDWESPSVHWFLLDPLPPGSGSGHPDLAVRPGPGRERRAASEPTNDILMWPCDQDPVKALQAERERQRVEQERQREQVEMDQQWQQWRDRQLPGSSRIEQLQAEARAAAYQRYMRQPV